MKCKEDGDRHFLEEGRVAEITIDLVSQATGQDGRKQGQRARRLRRERDDQTFTTCSTCSKHRMSTVFSETGSRRRHKGAKTAQRERERETRLAAFHLFEAPNVYCSPVRLGSTRRHQGAKTVERETRLAACAPSVNGHTTPNALTHTSLATTQ